MAPSAKSIVCVCAGFTLLWCVCVICDDNGEYMQKLLKALNPTPAGWSNDTYYCSWRGVACGMSPDSSMVVTKITLPSMSLTGLLPAGLNNSLKRLMELNLQNNSLSGPFPSLANLTLLQSVDISNNNFTSIPNSCFPGLTNLVYLNLSNNTNLAPWTFPTDLIQSPVLDTLDLQATNIMGSLPDIFEAFTSLKTLALSRNGLSGNLPPSLGASPVKCLRLDNQSTLGWGFSGTIEVISTMTSLYQAWLSYNQFDGPIPDLSKCTHLFDLQLHSNFLIGVVPPSLTHLPSLKNVSLRENGFAGTIPVFGKGVKVDDFVKSNYFCQETPEQPCDMRVTTLLEIAGAFGYPPQVDLQGKDPCNWTYVVCVEKNIIALNLQKLDLNGTISPAFANLTLLRKLNLNDNHLRGSIPLTLTTLPELKFLDVSNNNLSGPVPNFSSKVKRNTSGNLLIGREETPQNLTFRNRGSSTPKHANLLRPLSIAGASITSSVAVVVMMVICKRKRYFSLVKKRIFSKTRTSVDDNIEDFIRSYDFLALKRYSYPEVKRITNSFQDKLGQGGYGIVYKASLPDGRHAAVKVISESKGNGEEFINEVASISRTSHVNIVSLLGFCYEMNKRALIYEFMSNGSLDKYIYQNGSTNAICNLDWNTLCQIAVGIARGLQYLHQGCTTRILHLDIKPQNILLDEDFCPKISDFGLAKICKKKESIVSMLDTRGTIGYIAPEMFSRAYGGVSYKSDVYSYGMLILEMIGGRKNYDTKGSCTDEMDFLEWIYRDLEQGNIPASCLATSEVENDMIKKITLVSLWCIQVNPSDRPSMNKVVEMLEGPLQLVSFPPKPNLHSPERSSLPDWSPIMSENISFTELISLTN